MDDGVKIEDATDIGLGIRARSIEEVSNTLASLSLDGYANEEFQKATYDELRMITSSPDVRTPLPFGLTLYVIRTLLYPTVVFDQAIDIIRLLAHVEEIRLHAGNRATAVLEWNKRVLQAQHNGDPGWMDVRAIEKGSKVEDNLQNVARNVRGQGNLYLTYKKLVGCWQAMDIYHLWISDDPSQLLHSHLLIYFPTEWPVPGESETEKAERVEQTWRTERMHVDRVIGGNMVERDEVFSSREYCLRFLRGAAEWTTNKERYCQEHRYDENASFTEIFDPPVDLDVLMTTTKDYLSRVQLLVDYLDDNIGGRK